MNITLYYKNKCGTNRKKIALLEDANLDISSGNRNWKENLDRSSNYPNGKYISVQFEDENGDKRYQLEIPEMDLPKLIEKLKTVRDILNKPSF